MYNTSYIELSESALKNNLDYVRRHLPANCTLSHVVKGNAYGHGISKFVPLLHKNGARHFSVFDAGEAYEVFKHLPPKGNTIMIMGMIEYQQLAWAIENEIEFYVFEIKRLHESIEVAKKCGKPAQIHLELETGMNRTGLSSQSWALAAEICKNNRGHIQLKGICTHYAGAENIANHKRIAQQIEAFEKGLNFFESKGLSPEKRHTACSAAFMRLPHTRMDMVRIGILQYGFWPSKETYIATAGADENPINPLKRVISWKSRLMNTKQINKGEYVGYGSSFQATNDMRIASVPVGYSHGFSRSLSNAGRVLVRGSRVPVIGIVNMNMMMIDISHLPEAETGDEAVLIGIQGDEHISVSSFSDFSNQLNYELLTRLPHNIPRYIVN